MAGRSNELKLRFGPRVKLPSMFIGLEPPESGLKFRTQALPHDRPHLSGEVPEARKHQWVA
jgi:hypothetical protein